MAHLKVAALLIKSCMSLMSPDMLFCTDQHDNTVLCDITETAKPDCKTMPALYKSWVGHPERREQFYNKLYGAGK